MNISTATAFNVLIYLARDFNRFLKIDEIDWIILGKEKKVISNSLIERFQKNRD